MGSSTSCCCCKKQDDIEKPILVIDGVYDDNNKLVKIADLIDNNSVTWKTVDPIRKSENIFPESQIEYYKTLRTAQVLRKKIKNSINKIETS
jgi:hypothetical protein